jgi:hypothetical protein
MRAFAHPDEALHDPQFFLTKGVVRSNFEIPARAASLRAGLAALGITPDGARAEGYEASGARFAGFSNAQSAKMATRAGGQRARRAGGWARRVLKLFQSES